MNIPSNRITGNTKGRGVMMKKILTVCVLIQAAVLVFAGSEELEMYTYLYNSAETHAAQLDLLENMAEQKLTGAGEFYGTALRRLVSEYKNINNATERTAADDQAILLAQLVGQEKYTPSAADLWLVARDFPAPLVKAEALMSLGKVQGGAELKGVSYLPQVIGLLNSLNMAPTADRLNGERIAFGAIISLEKYKDPKGYLPVYFASKGWYSDRIKNQALKTLPIISDDPTPSMIEIIKSTGYNYPTKFAALQNIEASNVSNDNKANVAVAALTEGWRASTSDVNQRNILASMRTMSMKMIVSYGTADDTVYAQLEKSYTSGIDIDEKKLALTTLATLATDESARRLSKFLMDLNTKRQRNTIKQEDEILVREVIPALGATKKGIARPALNSVGALDWTPAVKTLASEALKQIP
jgi:hypothetical protein